MNTPSNTGVSFSNSGIHPLPSPPIPVSGHHLPPVRWRESEGPERYQYLQTGVGHYLEIRPNGIVKGNPGERTIYGIIMLISFVTNSTNGGKARDNVVIQGYVSQLFLCMNNKSVIYARRDASPDDCAFSEKLLKNNHNVYYHTSYKEKRKKFYIGIDHAGRMKLGLYARHSQKMSQFLPVPVQLDRFLKAKREREKSSVISLVTPKQNITLNPIKRKRNERRSRRRRWCSKIRKIKKNPQKYIERCKNDCDLLKKMIDNFPKHKRRCARDRKRRKRPRGESERRHRRHRRNRSIRHRKRKREGRRERYKRLSKIHKKLIAESKQNTLQTSSDPAKKHLDSQNYFS